MKIPFIVTLRLLFAVIVGLDYASPVARAQEPRDLTHTMGRLVQDGRRLSAFRLLEFSPASGELGPPRFVVLHFDSARLSGRAKLSVDLGYDQDHFGSESGSEFWTRPIDGQLGAIELRIAGGLGSARLLEYMVFESTISPDHAPGTDMGSFTSPDAFLHSDPYAEPIYETRLMCDGAFDWHNAACSTGEVQQLTAAAVGFVTMLHEGHANSCSGTLIADDLFLTAKHCLEDEAAVRSASVTFDFATLCDGRRPPGHATIFNKVIGTAASGAGFSVVEDWIVLRLDTRAGDLPTPAAIRSSPVTQVEPALAVHHPNGAAKKLQEIVFDPAIPTLSGDYAGGSSGSATFDGSGRLITGPLSSGHRCSASYVPLSSFLEPISESLRVSIRNFSRRSAAVRIYLANDSLRLVPLPGGDFRVPVGATGHFTIPDFTPQVAVVVEGKGHYAVRGSEIVYTGR